MDGWREGGKEGGLGREGRREGGRGREGGPSSCPTSLSLSLSLWLAPLARTSSRSSSPPLFICLSEQPGRAATQFLEIGCKTKNQKRLPTSQTYLQGAWIEFAEGAPRLSSGCARPWRKDTRLSSGCARPSRKDTRLSSGCARPWRKDRQPNAATNNNSKELLLVLLFHDGLPPRAPLS